LWANAAAQSRLGWAPGEHATPPVDILHAIGSKMAAPDRHSLHAALASGQTWAGPLRVRWPASPHRQRSVWHELTVCALDPAPFLANPPDASATLPRFSLWTLRDAGQQMAMAAELRALRLQAEQTLAFAGIGRLHVDLDTGHTALCERQARMLELGHTALTVDWEEVRERIDGEHLAALDEAIEHAARTGLPIDLETRMRATQAATGARWLHWRGQIERPAARGSDDTHVSAALVLTMITQDISSRREALERLSHRAHHDPLTGLPNRLLFEDRLANAVRLAERERSCCAVLFVDLDGFKEINDRFGHDAGDHVLRTVGQRLCESVRRADTVARLGGDEFVVLLPRVADLAHARQAREKIAAQLNGPLLWGAHRLLVGASVGLAAYPDHGLEPRALLIQADLDMYRVKTLNAAGRPAAA
jgi:diguanylate cyclase (GGDEF)-like protein